MCVSNRVGVAMSGLHSMFEEEGRPDLGQAKRGIKLCEPWGTLIMPCTVPSEVCQPQSHPLKHKTLGTFNTV